MNDEVREYHRNGFFIKPWVKTPTLERLNAVRRDLFEGRIKEGYAPIVHYVLGRDVYFGP